MSCALQQVHPQLVVFGGSSRALECSFFSNVTMYTSQSSYKYTAVHITLFKHLTVYATNNFPVIILNIVVASYFFLFLLQGDSENIYWSIWGNNHSVNCEQDWKVSGHCSIPIVSPRNNLRIVHRIVYSSHFQWPGNSQGMLSQEWAAYNKANLLNQN